MTFSLDKIIEKINNTNSDSLEILEWNQVDLWQKRLDKLKSECLFRYIVIPNTKDMLSQFLKICCEEKQRICILGNGSKISWGKVPKNYDFFISCNKLNNIIEHSVEDLTLTVEAGARIADIQEFLKPTGQFLAIDPYYPSSATVGGVVATANTGSWRHTYGGVRDLILGISFLRSDGQEVKAGGKVMKNVAGYDLMKLMTGSYGNLGLITSVTFRLFPIPPQSYTVVITGQSEAIQKFRQTLLFSGLTPTTADFISHCLSDRLGLGRNISIMLRFQTIEASINQQVSQVKQWAKELNLSTYDYGDETEQKLWSQVKEYSLHTNSSKPILCKFGMLSDRIVEFLNDYRSDCLINLSSGVGYGLWSKDSTIQQLKDGRKYCENNSGYLTILEADESVKEQIEPWGYIGNGVRMMKILKQKFDPNGLFCDRI